VNRQWKKLLCFALIAVFAFASSACNESAAPNVGVSEDGYLIVDGVKTEYKVQGEDGRAGQPGQPGGAGGAGASAYELYKKYNPAYTGGEEQWMKDFTAGRLQSSYTYSIVANGKAAAASPITGTAAPEGRYLKLTDGALALEKDAILQLTPDSDWQIELTGVLFPGGSGGGQFLSNTFANAHGKIYYGCNYTQPGGGIGSIFVGVYLKGIHYNYTWNVPQAVLNSHHKYVLGFDGAEFYLSVDGGESQGLLGLKHQQGTMYAGGGSAAVSKELSLKIEMLTGQKAFTMSSVGVDTFLINMRIENYKITTSNLFNYEELTAHPLAGKTVYYLGSSITRGERGLNGNTSFVEQIAELTGNTYEKNAVSGTALAWRGNGSSYAERLTGTYDGVQFTWAPSSLPDALVVQFSTNDFSQGIALGTVTDGTAPESFDKATTLGAIESIIAKTKELSPNTKVVFYIGYVKSTWGSLKAFQSAGDSLKTTLAHKWGIEVIDLLSADFIKVGGAEAQSYLADDIHPNELGYIGVFTPVILGRLKDIL
jgi:lysophospholipase L1-like esterase